MGWINASIKDVHGAPVGDTLTLASDPADKPLPGFQEMQPRVFAGLTYTIEDERVDYGERRFQTYGLLDERLVVIVWAEIRRGRRISR